MKVIVKSLAILALLLSVCASGTAHAAEPAEQFLNALLENHYYDEAMVYLQQMESSPLATPEFKAEILYRQGIVLIAASRFDRDTNLRQTRLTEAQSKLTQFIQEHQNDDAFAISVAAATEELAKISVENARIQVTRAKGQTGSQQQASFEQARTLFDEAIQVYQNQLEKIRADLLAIREQFGSPPRPDTPEDVIEQNEFLQSEYLRAMLTIPMLRFEKGETYPADDPARLADFELAGTEFADMSDKYRNKAAGISARLWSGRCQFELGNFDAALTDFSDILELSNEDPFLRGLRAHAMHYSMKIWVSEERKAYDEAILAGQELIDSIRAQEEKDLHWLGVRYYLALAYKLALETNTELTGTEKAAYATQAQTQAQAVAVATNVYNPYLEMAQRLLAELSGEAPEPEEEEELVEPTNFVEAKQFGDDATRAMQSAQGQVRILKQGPSDPNDAEAVAAMQEELARAEQQVIDSRARALYCYQRAIELAEPETPLDDLNQVRFLLSYYMYTVERYHEAAVLADFYARNYTNSPNGMKAATFALASYQNIYRQATQAADPDAEEQTPEEQFAIGKVLATADFIARAFPDEPEAQEALITLIRSLVGLGDLDKAMEYLQLINPDGSKRGEAELILGRALWRRYKEGVQATSDQAAGLPVAGGVPDIQSLEQSKRLAQQALREGIDRQVGGEGGPATIDATLVDALLSLTEIYVDTGQPMEAILLLENPQYGLLPLLAEEHPAVMRANFPSAVYRAALRAYIAAAPEQEAPADSEAMRSRASQAMLGLKAVTPNPRQLIALYFSLARDIKSQLDLVENPEKKASLAKAFEAFLLQIAESTNNKTELIWVADSLLNVGRSFDPGPTRPLPPTASELYDEAVNRFNDVLAKSENGELELSPEEELQLRVRLAGALRSMRQYRLAINEYDAILSANNGLLPLQIEAAQTYEDWAASDIGVDFLYVVALRGGRWEYDKQNFTIWGWGGIAGRTVNDVNYRDIFYQARYHWAKCNLAYAAVAPEEERATYLTAAEQVITSTDVDFLTPALSKSGEEMSPEDFAERDFAERWRPQFNELKLQLDAAQGVENPEGLPPLQQ